MLTKPWQEMKTRWHQGRDQVKSNAIEIIHIYLNFLSLILRSDKLLNLEP